MRKLKTQNWIISWEILAGSGRPIAWVQWKLKAWIPSPSRYRIVLNAVAYHTLVDQPVHLIVVFLNHYSVCIKMNQPRLRKQNVTPWEINIAVSKSNNQGDKKLIIVGKI